MIVDLSIAAQLFLNGVIAGSLYSFMGVGFGLGYRANRFFNFAYGGIFTAGAYCAYLLRVQVGLCPYVSFPLAALASAVLGLGLERLIYRQMRRRRSTDLALLVASLGLYVMLQNIISILWGDDTLTMRRGPVEVGHQVLGAYVTNVQAALVVSNLVVVVVVSFVVLRSRWGKVTRAVSQDPELARLCGVPVDRYTDGAVALASLLAGACAILVSFDTDLTPTMGFTPMVMAVVAVMVGGRRLGIVGVALAGLFLGVAENVAVWWLPAKWKDSVTLAMLMVIVLTRGEHLREGPFARMHK